MESLRNDCYNPHMAACFHEIRFRVHGAGCDGRLAFISYGEAPEEAREWGEKQAWDFIHGERPTSRILRSIGSVPVADYLLTSQGLEPLHPEGMRRFMQGLQSHFPRLGVHESCFIRPAKPGTALSIRPPDWTEPIPPKEMQALYIIVFGETGTEAPREASLCRAANLRHASSLWRRHARDRRCEAAPAALHLCPYLCKVGQPLFSRKVRHPRN